VIPPQRDGIVRSNFGTKKVMIEDDDWWWPTKNQRRRSLGCLSMEMKKRKEMECVVTAVNAVCMTERGARGRVSG